jgi:hypothetical protein
MGFERLGIAPIQFLDTGCRWSAGLTVHGPMYKRRKLGGYKVGGGDLRGIGGHCLRELLVGYK